MTTREQSMQWWTDLFEYINPSGINKSALTEKYFGKERRYQSLTGREIEEIWRKEIENIYLNRLKEQYKKLKEFKANQTTSDEYWKRKDYYDAMRLFCLDTQLVSFNDIEAMEFEVSSSF